ncbi:MAG: DUF4291 domain-containing protein [Polyangiales bacterium]
MGPTESYLAQKERWPKRGRHILAQYTDDAVIVYQAFRTSTGRAAAEGGAFGEGFSLSRMSWIKPNFLWMMFRSGWATKEDQEVVLSISLKRSAFDRVLAAAVHSTYVPEVYGQKADWQLAVRRSDVRLQWDPDHSPRGGKVERRAIQLGLSGKTLERYAREWIVGIEDITDFVHAQHEHVTRGELDRLETPREEVYPVEDRAVAARLEIDPDTD